MSRSGSCETPLQAAMSAGAAADHHGLRNRIAVPPCRHWSRSREDGLDMRLMPTGRVGIEVDEAHATRHGAREGRLPGGLGSAPVTATINWRRDRFAAVLGEDVTTSYGICRCSQVALGEALESPRRGIGL